MSGTITYGIGDWKDNPHLTIDKMFYLGMGKLELTIEPLTDEELSKMDRIDLSRTEPAGNWERRVARKTPRGGRRITVDHGNYRETEVKLWFDCEELKMNLVPKPDKKEVQLVFEYALKSGGKFTETKIVGYG